MELDVLLTLFEPCVHFSLYKIWNYGEFIFYIVMFNLQISHFKKDYLSFFLLFSSYTFKILDKCITLVAHLNINKMPIPTMWSSLDCILASTQWKINQSLYQIVKARSQWGCFVKMQECLSWALLKTLLHVSFSIFLFSLINTKLTSHVQGAWAQYHTSKESSLKTKFVTYI